MAERNCITCRHDERLSEDVPCRECHSSAGWPYWAPKTKPLDGVAAAPPSPDDKAREFWERCFCALLAKHPDIPWAKETADKALAARDERWGGVK